MFLLDSSENIEVVLSLDSALDITEEQWAEYQKEYDRSVLTFKEGQQPTLFILRRVLPLGHQKKVDDQKVTYEKGEAKVTTSFIYDEVRAALIDIKNPDGVPDDKALTFKRDSDGLCHKDIIEMLAPSGMVHELYQARTVVTNKKTANFKKKS